MAVPVRHGRKRTTQPGTVGSMHLDYAGKVPIGDILGKPPGRYTVNPAYRGQPNRLYHDDNLPAQALAVHTGKVG